MSFCAAQLAADNDVYRKPPELMEHVDQHSSVVHAFSDAGDLRPPGVSLIQMTLRVRAVAAIVSDDVLFFVSYSCPTPQDKPSEAREWSR